MATPEVQARRLQGLVKARATSLGRRLSRLRLEDVPYPDGETVPATFEDIADWARLNGIAWRSWDDLAAVNHARSLRLAPPLLPFERHWPIKGRFG